MLPPQKSSMFDLATVKDDTQCGHTCIRWTAAENMLADPFNKKMDTDHVLRTLRKGEWGISHYTDLVNPKTTSKGKTMQKQKLDDS